MNKRGIGNKGEAIAASFLENNGIVILERNYQNRFGNVLLFIEVKYRKDESFGYPLESVGYFKQQKIRKLARYYLNEKHYFMHSIRFDCIGIMGEKIDWIKGAFY